MSPKQRVHRSLRKLSGFLNPDLLDERLISPTVAGEVVLGGLRNGPCGPDLYLITSEGIRFYRAGWQFIPYSGIISVAFPFDKASGIFRVELDDGRMVTSESAHVFPLCSFLKSVRDDLVRSGICTGPCRFEAWGVPENWEDLTQDAKWGIRLEQGARLERRQQTEEW